MTTAAKDNAVAWILWVAVVAQGIGVVWMDGLGFRSTVQVLVVAVALAAAVGVTWRVRMGLNHRIDMLLVMLAVGGLGMLVGMAVDRYLQLASGAAMDCGHCSEPSGSPWSAVWTWMTGLMLLAAIPASLAWTRCAELARSNWKRWVSTHLIGNAAMVVGMIWFGRWLGPGIGRLTGASTVGHHVGMLIGMLVGMEAGMFLGEALFGLKPWREWRWRNDEPGTTIEEPRLKGPA
jgi:hypothetical protein